MPRRGREGRRQGRRRHGYGQGVASQDNQDSDWSTCVTQTDVSPEDIENSPHMLFTCNTTLEQHQAAQEKDKNFYLATLQVLLRNGVEISQGIRVKALAAAWARQDHALAHNLLADSEHFTLAELLKVLTLLEAGRRVREKERRLRQLQVLIQDKVKVKPKKLSKVKSDIDNLNAWKPKVGSVSGALSRHIRRWVRGLSGAQLQFYALHYPKEPWKKLADICHLNPTKDFPEAPWFLPFCFGAPAPAGTLVAKCDGMSAENINELVQGCDVPYSHIKQFSGNLNEASKVRIATYEEKVDTLLWHYEDLNCPAVDEIICKRLYDAEEVNLTSGKLMERLLMMTQLQTKTHLPYFARYWTQNTILGRYVMDFFNAGNPVLKALIPVAERRLKAISVSLEAPVAILGDRSPSMDVAIKTSSIIACLLTAITDAKLSFFSNYDYVPPKLPKTIPEALEMASTLNTDGSTAPAASLWPYYERKEVIKTFVVVTDEYENCEGNGYRFTPLYKKYREEVYDARLVFISFIPSQHSASQMVTELRDEGIHPMQFKFCGHRPDLTKLDNVLGLLSVDTVEFKEEVTRVAQSLAQNEP